MRRSLHRTKRQLLARLHRDRFRRNLDDLASPISLDLKRDCDTLLIAFGGLGGRLGMAEFEFFKCTGEIPVKRVFVRDLRQAWYQRGVPGYGATPEEFACWLLELVQRHDVRRLVVTGNSAGGYAALLFGTLLGADRVQCFSPQTVLDRELLDSWNDHRWPERRKEVHELVQEGQIDRRWLDLAKALPAAEPLPGASRSGTQYELYFDDEYEIDRLHAGHVADVPSMHLHPRHEGGEHSLVRQLRSTGELGQILQRGLLAPPPSWSTASNAAWVIEFASGAKGLAH